MFQPPIGWGLSCDPGGAASDRQRHSNVSIPYWLGSKLRCRIPFVPHEEELRFQSPIGWGLSCDANEALGQYTVIEFQSPIGWGLSCDRDRTGGVSVAHEGVSIPYWLGSKLRSEGHTLAANDGLLFQSPIGWGLSCDPRWPAGGAAGGCRFNPLLVGV